MNYFAAWSILGVVAALFIGFETRGRTIEEIDRDLTGAPAPAERAAAG